MCRETCLVPGLLYCLTAFSGLIAQIILQNYKLSTAVQRHRLLIEHRLDRPARCLDVEAVLLD